VSNGWVSRRRVKGIDHYSALSVSDLEAVVEVHEEEEADMKRKRYSRLSEELHGKGLVAVRALKKLLSDETPQPRTSLFTVYRGDKFQERAALSPPWQMELLQVLTGNGVVVKIDGNPTLYKIGDHEAAQNLVEGIEHPCIISLIDPNTPCGLDHESMRQRKLNKERTLNVKVPTHESIPEEELPTESIVTTSESVIDQAPAFPAAVPAESIEEEPKDKLQEKEDGLLETILEQVLDSMKAQNALSERIANHVKDLGGYMKSTNDFMHTTKESLKHIDQRIVRLEELIRSSNSDSKQKAVSKLEEKMIHDVISKCDESVRLATQSTITSLKIEIGSMKSGFQSMESAIAEVAASMASISAHIQKPRSKMSRKARWGHILGRLDVVVNDLDTLKELALETVPGSNSS